MANILIINGNPKKESLSLALAKAYQKGAEASKAEVKIIHLADLNLPEYFKQDYIAEDAEKVKEIQNDITSASHLVWVYPTWWYAPPALVKSFIEQVFTSGYAFKYKKNPYRVTWDSYLTGKTAHIISTMDAPPFFYRLFVKNPGGKMMKHFLKFVGIKPIRQTYFGSVKLSKPETRAKWIQKIEQLGTQLK